MAHIQGVHHSPEQRNAAYAHSLQVRERMMVAGRSTKGEIEAARQLAEEGYLAKHGPCMCPKG